MNNDTRKSKVSFERLVSGVLTIAALVLTAAVVHREFFPRSSGTIDATATGEVQLYEGWQLWTEAGTWSGEREADVVVIEFVDFQCVGCKIFHDAVVKPLKNKHESQVAFVYIHLPLRSHPYSVDAAAAAECAHVQGRFDAFVDVLFREQSSIGNQSWSWFAEETGGIELRAFQRCVADETQNHRIVRGRALADSLGIRATPTIVVNGMKYPRPPSLEQLELIVDEFRAVSPAGGTS